MPMWLPVILSYINFVRKRFDLNKIPISLHNGSLLNSSGQDVFCHVDDHGCCNLIAGGKMSMFSTPHGVGSPNHSDHRTRIITMMCTHPYPEEDPESLILLFPRPSFRPAHFR